MKLTARRRFGLAAVASIAAMTLVMSGCTDSGPIEPGGSNGEVGEAGDFDGLNFGFITAGNTSEFQIAQGEWFKIFAEEEGASVTVIDGKFDPAEQQRAMDDLIARNVDAILIQAADGEALASSLSAARAADIPVISIGGPSPASVPLPAIPFDDSEVVFQMGQTTAEWVKTQFPGEKAKVVIFDIPSIELCRVMRMDNFVAGVEDVMGAENTEIVFRDHVDHVLDATVNKAEDLIQAGTDFNIMTACGGTGTIGMMQALAAAGRGTAVDGVPQTEFLASIDATPGELEYLIDPTAALKLTIALTPRTNAQVYVDVLKQLLAGSIDPDEASSVVAPGALLPQDCAAISELLASEYEVLRGYEPLSCS